MVEIFFEAEYVSGEPDATEDDEIAEARWFENLPDDVAEIVAPESGIW